MKNFLINAFKLILLVICCEFIYWGTSVFLVYNPELLEGGFPGFLYYALPAVTLIILCGILFRFHKKLSDFGHNLLFVLINTYWILCLFMLTGEYCDPVKNLDTVYSVFVTLCLLGTAVLVITRIIPSMTRLNIIVVVVATILTFLDFNYFLLGFKIFYPYNW